MCVGWRASAIPGTRLEERLWCEVSFDADLVEAVHLSRRSGSHLQVILCLLCKHEQGEISSCEGDLVLDVAD